jgi:hypothetical protein
MLTPTGWKYSRCRDAPQRYGTKYVFIFLLEARASCPCRRDEGGTPLLPGAGITVIVAWLTDATLIEIIGADG